MECCCAVADLLMLRERRFNRMDYRLPLLMTCIYIYIYIHLLASKDEHFAIEVEEVGLDFKAVR